MTGDTTFLVSVVAPNKKRNEQWKTKSSVVLATCWQRSKSRLSRTLLSSPFVAPSARPKQSATATTSSLSVGGVVATQLSSNP